MNSYDVENELGFQNLYSKYLENKGLAGLKFDKIEKEVWLDKEKKNRIDIKATLNNREYYYELKDYRKLSASQVYYKLGDLFLQLERYCNYIDRQKHSVKAAIMLPKNMPASMLEDISIMFRARKFFIEIFTTENIYVLDYESIERLNHNESNSLR